MAEQEITRTRFSMVPIELVEACAERQRKGWLFVYLWLWHYAGKDDQAFPSVSRLALECHMNLEDTRAALAWLTKQGWIKRVSRPGRTCLYHIRTERPPRKRSPRKGSQPTPTPKGVYPLRGSTRRGTPTPKGVGVGAEPLRLKGEGYQSETGTTPTPEGTPNKKETSKPEGLCLKQGLSDYVSKEHCRKDPKTQPAVPDPDGPAPAPVPTPDGVGTVPAHTSQAITLPPCAEPHRPLVVAWWRARLRKHPNAPNALSEADVAAMVYADAQGVLPAFLADAEARSLKSLGHQYRATVSRLQAGPGIAQAFSEFQAVYMAITDKAHGQSVTLARDEFITASNRGLDPAQITAALRRAVAAHDAATRSGRFAPQFPDMARWLRDGRHLAYAQHSAADGTTPASLPPRPTEESHPDPQERGEAYRRWICAVQGLDPDQHRQPTQPAR